jgi:hypothetical protein
VPQIRVCIFSPITAAKRKTVSDQNFQQLDKHTHKQNKIIPRGIEKKKKLQKIAKIENYHITLSPEVTTTLNIMKTKIVVCYFRFHTFSQILVCFGIKQTATPSGRV